MSRWLPWLAELMPELFCEISPELAAEKGIKNGEYITIETARGEVQARALVTRRMRPFIDRRQNRPRDRPAVALGLAGHARRATW